MSYRPKIKLGSEVSGVLPLAAGGTGTDAIEDLRRDLRLTHGEASEAGNPIRTIGVNSTAWETACDLTLGGTPTTDWLRQLVLVGEVLNASAGAINLRMRVRFGATTMHDTSASVAANVDFYGLLAHGVLLARGATNAQLFAAEVMLAGAYAGTSGFGNWAAKAKDGAPYGRATEDATADLSLAVDFQWGAADPNTAIRVYGAHVLLTPGTP